MNNSNWHFLGKWNIKFMQKLKALESVFGEINNWKYQDAEDKNTIIKNFSQVPFLFS